MVEEVKVLDGAFAEEEAFLFVFGVLERGVSSCDVLNIDDTFIYGKPNFSSRNNGGGDADCFGGESISDGESGGVVSVEEFEEACVAVDGFDEGDINGGRL